MSSNIPSKEKLSDMIKYSIATTDSSQFLNTEIVQIPANNSSGTFSALAGNEIIFDNFGTSSSDQFINHDESYFRFNLQVTGTNASSVILPGAYETVFDQAYFETRAGVRIDQQFNISDLTNFLYSHATNKQYRNSSGQLYNLGDKIPARYGIEGTGYNPFTVGNEGIVVDVTSGVIPSGTVQGIGAGTYVQRDASEQMQLQQNLSSSTGMTVIMKPSFLPLLSNNNSLMPGGMGPLKLVLRLARNPNEVLCYPGAKYGAFYNSGAILPSPSGTFVPNTSTSPSNGSPDSGVATVLLANGLDIKISNVVYMAKVYKVSPAVLARTDALMREQKLIMYYDSYFFFQTYIQAGSSVMFEIRKAVSNAKSFVWSLTPSVNDNNLDVDPSYREPVSRFQSYQMLIGTELVPRQPITNVAELFQHSQEGWNQHGSIDHWAQSMYEWANEKGWIVTNLDKDKNSELCGVSSITNPLFQVNIPVLSAQLQQQYTARGFLLHTKSITAGMDGNAIVSE